MRARFGGYFFGQIATFVYLTQVMQTAPQFDIAGWPQFSLYNLVVANFWPLYWVAHFVDPMKVNDAYWHVYMVAEARAADAFTFVQYLTG